MPSTKKPEIKPAFKLWFEINGKYIFGEGTYNLLEKIREEGSLSAAAKTSGMSYRYAWGLIKDAEEHLGMPVVRTQRGGKHGGKTDLTRMGLSLVTNYKKLKKVMTDVCRLE
ncbi:winged helix-turn-helix domain-containing protein [Candidatus Bathyarchaeota archaeon]|nr:winged helix-turn-helix domain-containing protein [Candidatus Bathyarchaeota archaeon]